MDSYLVRIWRPAGTSGDDGLRGVVTDLASHTTTTFPDRSSLLRLLQPALAQTDVGDVDGGGTDPPDLVAEVNP